MPSGRPDNLTPSVIRCLERAEELAAGGSDQPAASRLLLALLEDESEARGTLEAMGTHVGGLIQALSASDESNDRPGDFPDRDTQDTWSELLDSAVEFRDVTGGAGEIQSEHLLCAVVASSSAAARLLSQYGVVFDSLSAFLGEKYAVTQEPIAVDICISSMDSTSQSQNDVLRIIDAAANRAREGLRAVEDFVRFRLNDQFLCRSLKQCRHNLTAALHEIDNRARLAARNTPQDVGTEVSTASETHRTDAASVCAANMKRLQESLRTLEEFGKCLSPEFSKRVEAIRYETYTLEKSIAQVAQSIEYLADRHVHVLLTESTCINDWEWTARSLIDAGAGIIQLREKSMPSRQLLERARQLRRWTHGTSTLLVINDRPDIAVASEADGVHVGQDDLPPGDARRMVGADCLVGVSTHSIEQARAAVRDGADYIGVGPVFASTTKSFDRLSGLEFVREVANEIRLPFFAIGGIGADNVASVCEAGATRIAVGSAVCGHPNPGTALRKLAAPLKLKPGGDQ